MKIYLAYFPFAKDQIATLDKVGNRHRLASFYFVGHQIQANRRKIVNARVKEIWKQRKKNNPSSDD